MAEELCGLCGLSISELEDYITSKCTLESCGACKWHVE